MNLVADLSFPKLSWRYLSIVWLLLLLVGLAALYSLSWCYWLVWLLFALFMYRWQFKQFESMHRQIKQIGFYQQQWWLLVDEQKININIESGSRLWAYWLLIHYSEIDIEGKGSKVKTLLLFKDSVSDKDYRDIRRHLLFLKPKKESSH